MEITIYSGFSHEKWWFSIVMLVYQRVISFFLSPSTQLLDKPWTGILGPHRTTRGTREARSSPKAETTWNNLKIQENLGEIWKISIVPSVKFRCHFLVKHKLQFLSGKCGCDSTRRPVRDLQDVWEGILGFTLISLTACGVACHWDWTLKH